MVTPLWGGHLQLITPQRALFDSVQPWGFAEGFGYGFDMPVTISDPATVMWDSAAIGGVELPKLLHPTYIGCAEDYWLPGEDVFEQWLDVFSPAKSALQQAARQCGLRLAFFNPEALSSYYRWLQRHGVGLYDLIMSWKEPDQGPRFRGHPIRKRRRTVSKAKKVQPPPPRRRRARPLVRPSARHGITRASRDSGDIDASFGSGITVNRCCMTSSTSSA